VISESLKKASLEILVLAMLSNEDRYPYQMVQDIIAKSGSRYPLVAGVAYPVLYRMEDKGYISCREEKIGKRRTIHMYHLEDSGRAYLREQCEDFFGVTDLIRAILNEKGEDKDWVNVTWLINMCPKLNPS